jgi:Ca2+-transporting ATPase
VACDESLATGESELVYKMPGRDVYKMLMNGAATTTAATTTVTSGKAPSPGKTREPMPRPGQDPFVLSGTQVLEGVGSLLVTATGANSFHGKILADLRDDSDDEQTPLQVRLAILAKQISRAGAIVAALLFGALLIRFLATLPGNNASAADKGKTFVDILIISLTVLVIAVPEGLPLAVTLSLAYATTRMLRDHNLVRRLKACEISGNATCVCSDKTGTLTTNKMVVVAGCVGVRDQFTQPQDEKKKGPVDLSSTSPSSWGSSGGISSGESSGRWTAAQSVEKLCLAIRELLRQSIAVNTTAFDDEKGTSFVGSNTESSLLGFARYALGMGPVAKDRDAARIVQLIPFDASRQCMAAVIELPPFSTSSSDSTSSSSPSARNLRVFVKGAPETLLSRCTRVVGRPTASAEDVAMTDDDKNLIHETVAEYAGKTLRTIGLAYRDFQLPRPAIETGAAASGASATSSGSKVNLSMDFLLGEGLVYLGVMAIEDPLRPGVEESIADCQRAGVTVRMVTGDNIETAKAIAVKCGILTPPSSGGGGGSSIDEALDGAEDSGREIAMEGSKFRALSDAQKDRVVPRLRVLARSSPDDKRELVERLRAAGEIVAVTGDGTNDASAMAAADVSFSMGGANSGTQVAREASSIIMMTDDFSCIVRAIMWGRAVNDSVKKFLQFQITVTVTSVVLAFVSAISNGREQSVLTPVQLMWINLFQDTLAALALATDPPQRRVLYRAPEARSAPLITIDMWKTIIGQSIYQLTVTFVLYFAGPHIFPYDDYDDITRVNTVVFNTYVWMQIANILNCRQYDKTVNVFEGVFKNWLFVAVSITMTSVQVLVIFVGGFAFAVSPITGPQWAISLLLAFLTLLVGMLIRLMPDWPLQKLIGRVPTSPPPAESR